MTCRFPWQSYLASEQLEQADLSRCMFVGELSLDGRLRPVTGVLPMVLEARKNGIETVILPAENAGEAAYAGNMEIIGAHCLADIVRHLRGEERISPTEIDLDGLFRTQDGIHGGFCGRARAAERKARAGGCRCGGA